MPPSLAACPSSPPARSPLTRSPKAGVTDAVPEALEASLQLSEAVLVDIGLPMGPVIASIHEKRAQMRSQIMEQGELAEEPSLGRRRLRDAAPQ